MSLCQVRSSLGLNPAHFAVSVQDRIAIVTNYNGGSMVISHKNNKKEMIAF